MSRSDEEQIQLLKSWWKQYNKSILLGVILFIIIIVGFRFFQKYKKIKLYNSSTIYMQILNSYEQGKTDEIKVYAKQLIDNYPRTPYAGLTSLMLAKLAVQNDNLTEAGEHLKFVLKKTSNNILRQIARIRLARVLIYNKNPSEALEILKIVDDKTFLADINEISGDAFLMLGKHSQAKQSYKKANGSSLLKLKMRNL